MTRLDMADYLGLTLETVSRTMTSLVSRGVIAANGRHSVIIRKPKELVLLAGESDNDNIYLTGPDQARQVAWPH